MIKISNIKYQIAKIILVGITLGILFNRILYSQTRIASPSPEVKLPTTSAEDKEIQILKDKVATKVAELREKNTKAVSGMVKEILPLTKDGIKLKIITPRDEDFEVKIDPDLTKFYQIIGPQKKEVKSTSVKKSSFIIVTGIKKEKSIDANFIYLDEFFVVSSGKLTEVNKQDFFVKLVTNSKENYTLDIESSTKQQMINIKTLDIENIGFSKIKEGDTINFVFKKTETPVEPNRYAALKILIIPQEYFIK